MKKKKTPVVIVLDEISKKNLMQSSDKPAIKVRNL